MLSVKHPPLLQRPPPRYTVIRKSNLRAPASNATELLEVRDALELTDEFRAQVAGSSACP